MDLYLVRHAPAFPKDPDRWRHDGKRLLTPEGEKEFRLAARGLARMVPQATGEAAETAGTAGAVPSNTITVRVSPARSMGVTAEPNQAGTGGNTSRSSGSAHNA